MKIYATNSGKKMAMSIAVILGQQYDNVSVGVFPDGQINCRLYEVPHNEIAIIIGNTLGPVEFTELMTVLDTVQGFGVQKTIIFIPYFGAGRQDRDDKEGEDIAARMQIRCIQAFRPNRLVFTDLHNAGIKNFISDPRIRVKELYAKPLFFHAIRDMNISSPVVVVSADVGRLRVALSYANQFGIGAGSIYKLREGPGKTEAMYVMGDVRGKEIIMLDDMIDSGTTIFSGAEKLIEEGAYPGIHLFSTHLVLTGEKWKKISSATVDGKPLFASAHGTDTIDRPDADGIFYIHSVAPLFCDYLKKEKFI